MPVYLDPIMITCLRATDTLYTERDEGIHLMSPCPLWIVDFLELLFLSMRDRVSELHQIAWDPPFHHTKITCPLSSSLDRARGLGGLIIGEETLG